MILLIVCALLILRADAEIINSLRAHSSDATRLKCDSLPYRTTFVGNRCYFAVIRQVFYNNASAECSSIIQGAKVATDAPAAIFKAMMVNSSKYHTGKDSGPKHTICTYDSGYECEGDAQLSKVIPGKCVHLSSSTHLFPEAETYCKYLGMYMPTIGNDQENSMIRGALDTEPAWIGVSKYNYAWKRGRNFARFSSCESDDRYVRAASQAHKECGWEIAAFIEPTGYWMTDAKNMDRYAVCVKDADNDFTRVKKRCVAVHEWNEDSEECEWTGDKNACAQLMDIYNRTWFFVLPNFPTTTHIESGVGGYNDLVSKVVVRRGCMFSAVGGGFFYGPRAEEYLVQDVRYGEHTVPCYHTSTLREAGDGTSNVACFCDPTEATISDHVPAPPPKKKCIERHAFNQTTQSCEWSLDPKYCGEVITFDGHRELLEIPNWPTNRIYDYYPWGNMNNTRKNLFLGVTEIIVRQHCWATLWNLEGRNQRHQTLPTAGYGKHLVNSYFNQKYSWKQAGTQRVICECIR